MREKLVKLDLVECVIGIGKNLFYNSPMEACIVICRTNKSVDRKGKVLFIDAKKEVTRKNAQSYLEDAHIEKIAKAYNDFATIEGFAAIATTEEIEKNESKLSIALYVRGEKSGEIISVDEALEKWTESSAKVKEAYDTLNLLLQGGEENGSL